MGLGRRKCGRKCGRDCSRVSLGSQVAVYDMGYRAQLQYNDTAERHDNRIHLSSPRLVLTTVPQRRYHHLPCMRLVVRAT